MRDKKRIPKIIKGLEKIWLKHPELRLGQLIGNVKEFEGILYYVEDEALIEYLERYYNA
jgi:uncharacterized protein YihD (DUF1040 family)